MELLNILYDFDFTDGAHKSYTVEIDKKTLSLIPPKQHSPPEWARLENHKCSHCPLSEKEYPFCPVAANLSHLVEYFKDKDSFDEVGVRVTTEERVYSKTLPLQQGIFSIFGLIMSTSACPYMSFLKPMARFHLPFSTLQETIVRSVSMYLLRQYFVLKKGNSPDMKLAELETLYDQVKEVNVCFIRRIRAVAQSDAELNAIVILHSFAELLTLAISNDLSRLEDLFQS